MSEGETVSVLVYGELATSTSLILMLRVNVPALNMVICPKYYPLP